MIVLPNSTQLRWFAVFSILMIQSSVAAEDQTVLSNLTQTGSQLITAEQLNKQTNSESLRILDVRSPEKYSKGHIPGALNINVGEWKKIAFDDADTWGKTVGPLGLKPGRQTVVYGDKLSDTARAWWLLKFVGVEHVSILDGGWDWWAKHERPIETKLPNVAASEFKPDFQLDRLEEFDSLKQSLDSSDVEVIDTRSDEEFGAGRIPGASHIEWTELVTADGRFKSKQQLQRLFRDKGIQTSETAVCY